MKKLKDEFLKIIILCVSFSLFMHLVLETGIDYGVMFFAWLLILRLLPTCLKDKDIALNMKIAASVLIGAVSFAVILWIEGPGRLFYYTVLLFGLVIFSCVMIERKNKR